MKKIMNWGATLVLTLLLAGACTNDDTSAYNDERDGSYSNEYDGNNGNGYDNTGNDNDYNRAEEDTSRINPNDSI